MHGYLRHEMVDDIEFLDWSTNLKSVNDTLVSFAVDARELLYDSYAEYFNLNDFSPILETLGIDHYRGDDVSERMAWKGILELIERQRGLIEDGYEGVRVITEWVSVYEQYLECALTDVSYQTYVNIDVGDERSFPRYFADLLVGAAERIRHSSLKKRMENVATLIIDQGWPTNEVQLGMVLG